MPDRGDAWTPEAAFTVDGQATDPSFVTVNVMSPSGEVTTHGPVDGALGGDGITRISEGVYQVTVQLDSYGLWYTRFEGTGDVEAAETVEVYVSSDPFQTGLRPDALCTLSEVKAYMNVDKADTDSDVDDSVLIRLINAASEYLRRQSQREFIPILMQPEARVVPVGYYDYLGLKVHTGDIRDVDSIASYDVLGTLVDTYTTGFVMLPYGRPPYTSVRLPQGGMLVTGGYVLVTGTWGFGDTLDGVPDDIRQATVLTVSSWYARDVERFGVMFEETRRRDTMGQLVMPESIPTRARDIIDSYRIYRVA